MSIKQNEKSTIVCWRQCVFLEKVQSSWVRMRWLSKNTAHTLTYISNQNSERSNFWHFTILIASSRLSLNLMRYSFHLIIFSSDFQTLIVFNEYIDKICIHCFFFSCVSFVHLFGSFSRFLWRLSLSNLL